MPRLKRYSKWDIVWRGALMPARVPTREARFGRRLILARPRIFGREFKVRAGAIPAALVLPFVSGAVCWSITPLSSGYDPAVRHAALVIGALAPFPLLLFSVSWFVDPSLVTLCRIRTRHTRRALALHVRGLLKPAQRDALIREIESMRRQATTLMGQPLGIQGSMYVAISSYWFRLLFCVAMVVPTLAGQVLKSHPSVGVALTQSMLVAVAGMGWYGSRMPGRLSRCLRDGRCPDCEYDLSGLPSPFAAEGSAQVDSGPARCPECGVPWPHVPAAFDETPS